jgi:hypothetical protein
MEHQILGTTMPVLSVSLSGGESVVAEVGPARSVVFVRPPRMVCLHGSL